MKRFRKIQLPLVDNISIEYIVDHDKSTTYILHKRCSVIEHLADSIQSILDSEGILLDDVVSVTVDSSCLFINSNYDGKSFKVVGED